MDRIKFKKFLQESISQQSSASAIVLSQLAEELLNHIPHVVHIGDLKTEVSDDTQQYYDVTNDQEEVDMIIADVKNSECPSIVIHDKGVTLYFDHIEYDNTSVVAYLVIEDGKYTLSLSPIASFSILTFQKSTTA